MNSVFQVSDSLISIQYLDSSFLMISTFHLQSKALVLNFKILSQKKKYFLNLLLSMHWGCCWERKLNSGFSFSLFLEYIILCLLHLSSHSVAFAEEKGFLQRAGVFTVHTHSCGRSLMGMGGSALASSISHNYLRDQHHVSSLNKNKR